MTRRKVRDENDAAELLDALEVSGELLPDFCRARGVDGRSLSWWRDKVQHDEAPASPGIRLVELTAERSRAAVYRVVVDRFEVEVDDHFRDDTLARLLAVVAGC